MDALGPYFLVLVALLGHPAYRIREASHCHLQRLGSLPIRLLASAGECHADPEIAARSKLLVDCWLRKHADEIVDGMRPRGWQRLPWLALPDFEGKLSYSGEAAGYVLGFGGAPEYENWSEATRLYLLGRITCREFDPWKFVRQIAERQRQWCRDTNAVIPPRP
jgi:hypothetical protein